MFLSTSVLSPLLLLPTMDRRVLYENSLSPSHLSLDPSIRAIVMPTSYYHLELDRQVVSWELGRQVVSCNCFSAEL